MKINRYALMRFREFLKYFATLRSVIDKDRKPGRFIILGSASRDLIKQSSESLAGRIGYMELSPFIYPEVSNFKSVNDLWIQGGFPDSFLAPLENEPKLA
jgi:predicted AAA+ superfamily ATPase